MSRPRSEPARRAILDAALALATRDGYAGVTVKGIAEAAGVGRQTVYRWWPSAGAVLLEAMGEIGAVHGAPPPSGDPLADLRTFLDATFDLASRAPVANVLLGLTAESFTDAALRPALRGYIAGRRALLQEVLERQGPPEEWRVPVPTVVDMVFGAMWYRLMNEHGPVGPELTEELLAVAVALRR